MRDISFEHDKELEEKNSREKQSLRRGSWTWGRIGRGQKITLPLKSSSRECCNLIKFP